MEEENNNSSFQSPVPEGTSDEHTHIEEPISSIEQERLTKLAEDNNLTSFHQSSGVHGIAAALHTDLHWGIKGDEEDLHHRHQAYGANINLLEDYPFCTKKCQTFQVLVSDSIKDTTIILLLCCATLSLLLGSKRSRFVERIVDGAIFFIMILIVACISVVVKLSKNRMNEKRRRKGVRVMRDSSLKWVAASEVVVGDIVYLQIGDQIPADGLFVGGNSLELDDDDHAGQDCFDHKKLHFMFTGSKVIDGVCSMLVTSVGENTETGNMMKLLNGYKNKESKLQTAVEKINSPLEKIGLILALLVLVVQGLQCFLWKTGCDESHNEHGNSGMTDAVDEIMKEGINIIKKQGARIRFFEMICILVFAVRDGLPLGLLVSFACASKKLKRNGAAIIRNLSVSGTVGFVNTICSGKTSDLSLDYTKMVDLWIGMENVRESVEGVNIDVINALREGIGINVSESTDNRGFLSWANQILGVDREKIKQNRTGEDLGLIKNAIARGFLLKRNGDDTKTFVKMHFKGPPETILSRCTNYLDMHGSLGTLDESKKDMFKKIIEDIASDSLQCFAFACKQVEKGEEEEVLELTDSGLTLVALVGLKNPYESAVKRAIEICGESGVKIKLIVGDDVDTARLIAINSAILKHEEDTEGAVVEASVFRSSSEEARALMVDNIRVMANASSLDMLLMVQCLKQKGDVVAVTGTCTRDSPSLKEADVGVLLGDKAETAKEHADIVVLGKTFATIVDTLKLGRCLCNNLQKFVQLHLTLNISAFAVNSAAAIAFGEELLEPFQLLRVNLVMDVLGALALVAPISPLAALGASASSTKTKIMWRNIIIQVAYQVGILLVIQFKGQELFHANQKMIKAIVFNIFVLCQVFVLINSRETEQIKLDHSGCFWGIVGAIVSIEVAISEIIAVINHGERLGLKNWCVCIAIAAMSTAIALVAKIVSWP